MIDDVIPTAVTCLKEESQAILDLIPRIDEKFNKIIDLVYYCKGRFIVTGVGKSGHIGTKIAATLASTGTPSFFVNPLDAYHGDLGMFTPEDVVLAISYSGQTAELLRIIPLLIDRKIPIIGMSGNPSSTLAQYSTYHLNIAVKREAGPLNLAPTSSTTATLAMGDAIACALIKKRNFKVSDFALFHPGGALGKKLHAKVKDYMISSDLPVTTKETKVCDAMIAISKAKLSIAVVMENNKIIGVITDGDVRRAMQRQKDKFFDLNVEDIMSKSPKLISCEAKLSEAAAQLSKYNIHSLVVVDDKGKFVGIIDSINCL